MKPKHESLKSPENLQGIYTKWAYNEIFKYIVEHPNKRPIEAVEDFLFMVDHAAMDAKTGEQSFIFSVAYDTAYYVYDNLMGKSAKDILKVHKQLIREAEMSDMMR